MPGPRVGYVDPEWARGVLAAFEQERADIRDDAAASHRQLAQVEHVMLADACKDIGLLKYGLGDPLAETRTALAEAAEAYLRVFELRGTQPAFRVTVVSGDGARPLRAPGATDDSLTNAARGLQAMYIALIAGGETPARQIAALIGDPAGAASVAPASEWTDTDDGQLAGVVKAMLLDNRDDALRRLRVRRTVSASASAQAAVLAALLTRGHTEFRTRVGDLLEWHRAQTADPENRTNIDLLFDVPALALCRLAVESALMARPDLPAHDVFLPLDLLDARV